jgi:Leucine-rich repeat (LRR) protein
VELLTLFTRLQVIQLQHNKLSIIPEHIRSDLRRAPRVIEYLQELNLSHNRFSELPPELFLLVNLRRLNLSHNSLTTFPQQILSFYRLEELFLGHNKIEHLPWALHKLRKLKILHIESNMINYIPNTIGKLMPTLVDLLIIPNPLESINDDDVVWACHNGYIHIILDYLLKQTIPPNYPFLADLKQAEEKKKDKLKAFTEDQNMVRRLLKSPKGLSALETFMEKEYSIENLLFFKAIYEFSRTYSSDIEITTTELVDSAKVIFATFIAEDSKYTINLPGDIHKELRRTFTDTFVFPKGINQWVFKPAARAILDLISRDTFRRFKSTPEGVALLKSMNTQNGGHN